MRRLIDYSASKPSSFCHLIQDSVHSDASLAQTKFLHLHICSLHQADICNLLCQHGGSMSEFSCLSQCSVMLLCNQASRKDELLVQRKLKGQQARRGIHPSWFQGLNLIQTPDYGNTSSPQVRPRLGFLLLASSMLTRNLSRLQKSADQSFAKWQLVTKQAGHAIAV